MYQEKEKQIGKTSYLFFFTPNNISTSGVLKIDFFGIPGGSSISRGESLTLFCEISGYSTEHTSIAIGHSVADGDFADLIRGDPPMVELKHEEFRCEDAGEFVCEVRFHTTTAIRRRFTVTLRDCKIVVNYE